MENILKIIERKHPVDKITVNDEKIWVFLRMKYFKAHQQTLLNKENNTKLLEKDFLKRIKLLKNIFYGLINWFKKYDYIAISTSREGVKKIIKDKYYDRLINPIIDELEKESVLNIEKPLINHHPIKQVYTDNIVSYRLIRFIAYIMKNITIKNYKIKNEHILQSIQDEFKIIINYKNIIKVHYSLYITYKLLYLLIKPKAIFVVCYYGNMAAIKAAKDLGIKVIEIQHGVIGEEHPAYNIGVDLDNVNFPDYLLVYGKRDLEHFRVSNFIDYKNVYPIGNYYIDYINENINLKARLKNMLEKYRFVVGVTLQVIKEDITIQFVKKAALLDRSICYLLIPRPPIRRDYSEINLPSNVIVMVDKQFYELMHYVDFHSTVYSTCALEAPSLGVQNIMINIMNLSKTYFENILTDEKITRYSDTPEEYVNLIINFNKLDRKAIYLLNKDIIAPNYKENVRKFIKILQSDV